MDDPFRPPVLQRHAAFLTGLASQATSMSSAVSRSRAVTSVLMTSRSTCLVPLSSSSSYETTSLLTRPRHQQPAPVRFHHGVVQQSRRHHQRHVPLSEWEWRTERLRVGRAQQVPRSPPAASGSGLGDEQLRVLPGEVELRDVFSFRHDVTSTSPGRGRLPLRATTRGTRVSPSSSPNTTTCLKAS